MTQCTLPDELVQTIMEFLGKHAGLLSTHILTCVMAQPETKTRILNMKSLLDSFLFAHTSMNYAYMNNLRNKSRQQDQYQRHYKHKHKRISNIKEFPVQKCFALTRKKKRCTHTSCNNTLFCTRHEYARKIYWLVDSEN